MIDCGCDEILLPQGSDGVDGKNAFTVTTDTFTQPDVGDPVTITVSDTLQNTNQWAIVDQVIKITDASGNGGWYQVTSITGTTQITAINLGYTGSSILGLTIASGAKVAPAGLQGPQGNPGSPGAPGLPGDPISLSLNPTQTLTPGSPATATISGGGSNYAITFGIPSGLPGASGSTLLTSYNIPSTTFNSNAGGFTSALIPDQGFDPSALCPVDGSAGRIKINLQCTRPNTFLTDKDDYFSLAFYVLQSLVVTEFKPSQNTTYFLDKYQQQFINNIPCETIASGVLSPVAVSSVTSVSIEIIINRISQTSFLYTVNYIWSNGGSFSNVFTGFVSSGFDFGLSTATYKMNIISASSQSPPVSITVRGNLTMEKITP